METVNIKDEFIKLGQVIKLAGLVENGVDAKSVILDGKVKYNGDIELRRGKKVYEGDTVEYNGKKIKIIKN